MIRWTYIPWRVRRFVRLFFVFWQLVRYRSVAAGLPLSLFEVFNCNSCLLVVTLAYLDQDQAWSLSMSEFRRSLILHSWVCAVSRTNRDIRSALLDSANHVWRNLIRKLIMIIYLSGFYVSRSACAVISILGCQRYAHTNELWPASSHKASSFARIGKYVMDCFYPKWYMHNRE
jgi:hypothetical protein